ncbi:BZ3500_MvSof-1268-A1-R1_Chr3-1g05760 [Microbotryum saponariae]|uniref:BZ3500_MvSof-1268-A1-R1_Chr3-1g05760 protein n=1 Tax=Microbotryum saponariae TaxID=289078 RepID=A0A2X0LID3_9BASI|nr:BZ3500_MvSof-1268-A1-R1_Chr3-1g05760 [Microbotryum saponariae]SDA04950.1 BZ3501_MvSof-1269-A2-R1_Chr3-1g05430 [Microbotryum saponariae]
MTESAPSQPSNSAAPGSPPSDGPILPIAHPHPDAKPPTPHELTSEQTEFVHKLIARFNEPGFALPTTLKAWRPPSRGWFGSFGAGGGEKQSSTSTSSSASSTSSANESVPLSDVEKCYWSWEQFQRVARAVKWDYPAAIKRAEEILVWRREFGIDSMTAEQVSHEGETGKELSFGYDFASRPILYMHPYRQNTNTSHRQIEFVVWCLERTLDLAPATNPPTEMLCLCIDFGASRNVKTPPTSPGTAKEVLKILQTYYCERLGRAICVDVPGFFWPFYTLVKPFVDPRTKDKIRFLSDADATDLIPASQLQNMFGGEVNLEYNHEAFFPAWTKMCEERRAANLDRWRKYGKGLCGLSELVIRGAQVPEGGDEGGERKDVESKVEVDESSVSATTTMKDDASIKGLSNGVDKLTVSSTPQDVDGTLAPASTKPTELGEVLEPIKSAPFVDAPLASESAVARAVEPIA